MQQTNKQHQTTWKNWKSNTKRRNKLQDSGTIREAPTRRQSNKVFWHRACNWTKDFSVSSKERQFLSVQTIHIKQPWTIFHMSELNFPSQKLQQNTKLSTEPSMTIESQRSKAYKPTESELHDNEGGDDPQVLHSDGTYNTDSPKCAP